MFSHSHMNASFAMFSHSHMDASFNVFVLTVYQVVYTLRKSTDGGSTWTDIKGNVVSFGHQGKFLYASVLKDPTHVSNLQSSWLIIC